MIQNLGNNIKKVRKQNKMTLKELSEKTGFSISFLSQLERGKSSATLESLKKISLALNINPGYFFEKSEDNEEIVENSMRETEMERRNILYQDLNRNISNPAFAPLLVTLKPNKNEGNLFTHNGQEFLYVLKGELTVQLGEKTHVLKNNDSIMLDSNIKHYWYNYTKEDVMFLCISYDK